MVLSPHEEIERRESQNLIIQLPAGRVDRLDRKVGMRSSIVGCKIRNYLDEDTNVHRLTSPYTFPIAELLQIRSYVIITNQLTIINFRKLL